MVRGKWAGAFPRLATSDGQQVPNELLARNGSRLVTRRRGVQSKKVVSAELLPFRPRRRDDCGPGPVRDATTLLPFLDVPVRFPDRIGELRNGGPPVEQGIQMIKGCGLHTAEYDTDELSNQGRTTRPVTKQGHQRTICPMGRGVSKGDFIKDFCDRVRSARITAGYNDPKEFAKLMEIEYDTYLRYESRTLLPHRYIEKFLKLTDADARILFSGRRPEQRKTGS